jgi:cell division protein FtsB|tara:strand:+ start:827 stop:1126 length:300 start_codon:yes stop_codon:yes gene_type:complete
MKNKLFRFFKSTYSIIIILFIIWMIFFDSNSIIVHNELNHDIGKLNEQKMYYINEINKDNKELDLIQSDTGLEKYAREKLFMKKDNEDIFIIEFDTVSK